MLVSVAGAQPDAPDPLTGTVRDVTDAPIPGVSIEVSGPPLGREIRKTMTDERGKYRVMLPKGAYTVKFKIEVFVEVRRDEVVVDSGGTTKPLDVTMVVVPNLVF